MAEVALLEIPDDCAILAAVGCVALRHSQLDYVLRLILKDAGDLQFDEAMSKRSAVGRRNFGNPSGDASRTGLAKMNFRSLIA
jgi:hypothetical protein